MDLAENIILELVKRKMKLATAESCTGGMLAAEITAISGASKIFDAGFITYSNQMKNQILGVEEKLLQEYGAVSEEAALSMAKGALIKTTADIAISITGIAGPTGGSIQKPVGLVYIAVITVDYRICKKYNFSGSRNEIRQSSVQNALSLLGVVFGLTI